MRLLDIIKKGIAVLAVSTVGCSSAEKIQSEQSSEGHRKGETDYPAWMLPVNVAIGYFGSLATHEGGHALAGKLAGGEKIRVSLLPEQKDGQFSFGSTEMYGDFSKTEDFAIDVAGPAATFVGGVGSRELLKTGRVPNVAQPTLAWYAALDKIGTYQQALVGIARRKHTDLGKQHVSVGIGLLAAQLAYDIYDIGSDDKFTDVLLGKDFYEPKKVSLNLEPIKDGIMLSFGVRF